MTSAILGLRRGASPLSAWRLSRALAIAHIASYLVMTTIRASPLVDSASPPLVAAGISIVARLPPMKAIDSHGGNMLLAC